MNWPVNAIWDKRFIVMAQLGDYPIEAWEEIRMREDWRISSYRGPFDIGPMGWWRWGDTAIPYPADVNILLDAEISSS